MERVFTTGAKRDTNEDKGRMDLVPWCVVGEAMEDEFLLTMDSYIKSRNPRMIQVAISKLDVEYQNILELSKIYQQGAKKYGEDNWKKGITRSSLIDSGIRHYIKYKIGYTDEQHFELCLWNLIALQYTFS